MTGVVVDACLDVDPTFGVKPNNHYSRCIDNGDNTYSVSNFYFRPRSTRNNARSWAITTENRLVRTSCYSSEVLLVDTGGFVATIEQPAALNASS
jgi:hypothetical protein